MNIWLINHYAVPPQYYPLARQTYFAKYLMEMGHTVTIFSASSVHNSNPPKNLITDGALWREETVDGVHHVYIRCCDYTGNGLKRIYNMCEFAWKLPGVCKRFPKPDAIVSTSMPPMSCAMGIHLARKYKVRGVAEIADLWPESIVAYGIAGAHNPAVIALRWLEKWIYKKADALVFTMEGGRDYIIEKGWDTAHGGPVDLNKVHHINNGVDLEVFDYNKEHYQIDDPDLEDPDTFKVVYTGSIRRVNGVEQLVDAAEVLKGRGENRVKLLIYGDGDEREQLKNEAKLKELGNIEFKGRINKEQVPYVLSKADLCLLHWKPTPITKFGMSMNKFFEYFAAGKPILSNSVAGYDLIQKYQCGISKDIGSADEYAECITKINKTPKNEFDMFCKNARCAAEKYDFKKLTSDLIEVIENV